MKSRVFVKKKDPVLYPKILDAKELETYIYNDLSILPLYPKAKNPVVALDKKYLREGELSSIVCDQGAVYSITSHGRIFSHSGKEINSVVYVYRNKGLPTGLLNFTSYTCCGMISFEKAFEKAGWEYDPTKLLELFETIGGKLQYT